MPKHIISNKFVDYVDGQVINSAILFIRDINLSGSN
jgi:hypothetical protein